MTKNIQPDKDISGLCLRYYAAISRYGVEEKWVNRECLKKQGPVSGQFSVMRVAKKKNDHFHSKCNLFLPQKEFKRTHFLFIEMCQI